MVANGGVSTISERAGAPVTNPGNVVGISTENPSFNSAKRNKKIKK